MTVLVALSTTRSARGRDAHSLDTRIALLDRALPSTPHNPQGSADVRELFWTARQITKRRAKISDSQELSRVATWLVEAMTKGKPPSPPQLPDSHQTTTVPMGPSRSVPRRSGAPRQ
jgi:hypothetical protein